MKVKDYLVQKLKDNFNLDLQSDITYACMVDELENEKEAIDSSIDFIKKLIIVGEVTKEMEQEELNAKTKLEF